MKKSIIKILLLGLMFSPTICMAQQISFGYDESGNRTSRKIIYLKANDLKEADSVDQKIEEQFIELLKDIKVTVTPNPNGGRFKVSLDNLPESDELSGPIQLFLHSLDGDMIYEINNLQSINQVDISNYPNGIYILTIISGREKLNWKVVKQ